jgi:hypothetical protein
MYQRAETTMGGIQVAALLVSRCRLGCSVECLCSVLPVDASGVSAELYRVATLMAREHTATSTITAHHRAHLPLSSLVTLSMFCC